MIIDSSALIAILQNEPETQDFLRALAVMTPCLLSAGNYLETSIVMQARHNEAGVRDLDALLATYDIDVVPLTAKQARMAQRASGKYGKGRHPAKLNFGDCIAYALAKDTGEPLLFKGNDFTLTDIEPVALPVPEGY